MSVAITLDFWGTLLIDPPSSDDRYKARRLRDFEDILAGAGERVSRTALDHAYEASAVYLSRIWAENKDVPVAEHVRAIITAVDRRLLGRLSADALDALVDAYAAPALLVPPAVDEGAAKALSILREKGYTLAVVSNTMRSPGATLRKLLERFGLLRHFAHTVFSDEVGVRKPDPAIFALALRELGGVAPEQTVFLDDFPGNVAAARALGMHGVLVEDDPSGALAELERLIG